VEWLPSALAACSLAANHVRTSPSRSSKNSSSWISARMTTRFTAARLRSASACCVYPSAEIIRPFLLGVHDALTLFRPQRAVRHVNGDDEAAVMRIRRVAGCGWIKLDRRSSCGTIASRRLMWPGACRHWLPFGPPESAQQPTHWG
jgi:hypothetical protein